MEKEIASDIADKLEVGDIVRVHNPLFKNGYKDYPVTKVDGNKAITKFRTFNTKIYNGRNVYVFGVRESPIYNNIYTVRKGEDDVE